MDRTAPVEIHPKSSFDFPIDQADVELPTVLAYGIPMSNCWNFRSRPPSWRHPRNKLPDDMRLVLAGGAFERIRPLEGIGASNLHLPPVIRLRPDDRDPPIPSPGR